MIALAVVLAVLVVVLLALAMCAGADRGDRQIGAK